MAAEPRPETCSRWGQKTIIGRLAIVKLRTCPLTRPHPDRRHCKCRTDLGAI
jgi:hypothetical protein